MGERTLLPHQRRDQIHRMIREKRFASVRELAESARVSSMTIRRDLDALEAEGAVRRVFGGAQIATAITAEVAYTDRLNRNREAKERIARLARSLVREGDALAIDGSTTGVYLAREIRDLSVMVVTNSLLVANELGGRSEVFVLGGTLRAATATLVGEAAEAAARGLHVDRAFVSGIGLHAGSGLTDGDAREVSLKRALMRIASTSVAMVDGSKFDRVALHSVAPLDGIDALLTEAHPEGELRDALCEAGVRVEVADA